MWPHFDPAMPSFVAKFNHKIQITKNETSPHISLYSSVPSGQEAGTHNSTSLTVVRCTSRIGPGRHKSETPPIHQKKINKIFCQVRCITKAAQRRSPLICTHRTHYYINKINWEEIASVASTTKETYTTIMSNVKTRQNLVCFNAKKTSRRHFIAHCKNK